MRKIEYATVIFLLVVQGFGCTASDKLVGQLRENQAPEVWLAIGPPEGSVTDYRVHVFWGGWDPDGEVQYFEWALTDNETGVFDPADTTGADKWHRTFATDSIFKVSADVLVDSSQIGGRGNTVEFRRAHTFFVRAVDEQGLPSSIPVYRSFTARTLSPEVFVTTPQRTGLNLALMPPTITFRWIGLDEDSDSFEPDSVRSILLSTRLFDDSWGNALTYIRDNPLAPEWSYWEDYHAEGDSGRFWTNDPPLAFGEYLFAAQAKDEAGAVTPVFDLNRNVRRVLVAGSTGGPTVEVRYKFMPPVIRIGDSPQAVILSIPAGLPVGFSWVADASEYGGNLHGFRYGWDILDVNDPEQWDISLTPFVGSRSASPTREFFFGTHTFFLEVMDNNGQSTRVTIVINIVPFTMERSLLVIDDWEEQSLGFFKTGGLLPSDDETDEFWMEMVDEVAGFSPGDVFHVEGPVDEVPITVLANYGAVIWNAIGSSNSRTGSALNDYVKFVHPDPRLLPDDGSAIPNIVEMYMEAGGKVLICGQNVLTTVINRDFFSLPTYPLVFRWEMTGNQLGSTGDVGIGEESFAYKDCCANVIDIAFVPNPNGVRRGLCSVGGVRVRSQRNDGLRACTPIDATYPFPRLTLRPEVAGIGKWYHESRLGLNSDIYNPPYFGTLCNFLAETSPPRDCFQPMYGLECLNTSSAIYGAPVAFWTSKYATRVPQGGGVPARSAVWGFEPAFFNPDQVKEAINIILFDEWQLPRH